MASHGGTRTGRSAAAALSTGMVGTALIMAGPAAFAGSSAGSPNPSLPTSSSATTSTTLPARPTTTTLSTPTTTGPSPTTSTTTTVPAGPVTGIGSPSQRTQAPVPAGVGVRASADTGFGKTISVSVDPKVILANGVSTSTATAYLTIDDNGDTCDAGNAPCYFTRGGVTFSSSDPAEKVGPTTNPTNQGFYTTNPSLAGYTATVTSSTKVEVATITATDTALETAGVRSAAAAVQAAAPVNTISASTSLTQVAGPASKISLALQPTSIVANGTSTSEATATVTDALGRPVAYDQVGFTSSDSGEKIGPVTDHPNGTYTAVVASSTKVQTDVITTTDSSVKPAISASADLVQTPEPAAHISLVVSPPSIPADGKTTSTATATVTDASGNPVSGDNVTFISTDPNEKIGVTTDGTGTYTTHITASSTVETATITAKDLSVTPSISATAPLTQTGIQTTATTQPPIRTQTTTAPSTGLAFTGLPAVDDAGLAAGLLAVGAGLVATVRRRRPRFAHSIKRR